MDTLNNQIIRGNKSKTTALEELDQLIQENDETYILYRNFLIKEPTRDPFEGTSMLLGMDTFIADVDDVSIMAGLNEGTSSWIAHS